MNYLLLGGTAIGFAVFAHALNNLGFSFATSPMSEVILASGIGLVFTGIAATAVRNEFFRNNHQHNHNPLLLPQPQQHNVAGVAAPEPPVAVTPPPPPAGIQLAGNDAQQLDVRERGRGS